MIRKNGHERQHETEYTFTRAFTDMCDEMQSSQLARVFTEIYPTGQKGVVHIEMRAVDARKGLPEVVLAKVSATYPDGKTLTLSAKLFQMSNSLYQMNEARLGDEWRQTMGSARK